MTTMLTLTAYAEHIGKSTRTVLRYLDAGVVPGAVKIGREWSIPADALPDTDTSRDVSVVTPTRSQLQADTHATSHDVSGVTPGVIPPGLYPLDLIAAAYRTTVGRIRVMGAHPRSPFIVGRFGPPDEHGHATWRVWVLQ